MNKTIWQNLSAAAVVVLMTAGTAFAQLPKLNYNKLNKQAAKEYLKPIRPGYEGKNPYWNGFAIRFLYAPAFDFQDVSGAKEYLYSAKCKGKTFTFKARKPNLALSPIWNKLPVGDVELSVMALDSKGNVIKEAGSKKFRRDYPFKGPYHENVCTYKEAAIKALLYIHHIPQILKWEHQTTPDMSLALNQYPCKTVSGTIRCELLLSNFSPNQGPQAVKIAKNCGEFLLSSSQPKDAPLAYFPPTYYEGQKDTYEGKVVNNNSGKTMSMEAAKAAMALLDLYDYVDDKRFYDHAIGIVETYKRMQNADGSFPMKLFIKTGKPVNEVCARPHPLLYVLKRLEKQYKVNAYKQMRLAAEHWMENYAFKKFEMIGQFEDTPVEGLKPFENLSHWTGVPYAAYLLESGNASPRQIKMAEDVINFGEDQFTLWQTDVNSDGIHEWDSPCVLEQYFYRMPVDDSAASMATAWMDLYKVTGDKLALAKAKALFDEITIVEHSNSGLIPTAWHPWYGPRSYDQIWISCCMGTVNALLEFSKLAGEK